MKIDFLCRDDNNTRLILIYAGWSAGPSIAADVRMEGWDVAVVHDFTDLCLDVSFLQGYYTVYLFAWSLGVYAASVTLPPDRVTAAFAINGTLSPVDDSHGIPAAVFRATGHRRRTRRPQPDEIPNAHDVGTLRVGGEEASVRRRRRR